MLLSHSCERRLRLASPLRFALSLWPISRRLGAYDCRTRAEACGGPGQGPQRGQQTPPNHSVYYVQSNSLWSHILIESLPLDRRLQLPRPIPGGEHSYAAHAPTTLKNLAPPLHTHAAGWRVIVTCRRSLHAVVTHNLSSRHAPAHALTGAHSRFVRSPCCCIANRHNALILAVRAAHSAATTRCSVRGSLSLRRVEH